MSCNSCAKGFSLLRQEKGCPSCGFSFCSKCLNNRVYLSKLDSEAKVCAKCKKKLEEKNNSQEIVPPDAYFKRLAATEDKSAECAGSSFSSNIEPKGIDKQIEARLRKLREDNSEAKIGSEEEIRKRLQAIKDVPPTSDADIHTRLAKLKGKPITDDKPVLPVIDIRTAEEQANDLLKQYIDQNELESKCKDQFDGTKSIEDRLQKLKGANILPEAEKTETSGMASNTHSYVVESEDEEESIRKIVEKIKAEATIEVNEIAPPTNDELPFCEICNEDATMRCMGCRYLFCKRCFREHKDEDDGCDRYEPYQPPKGCQY